MIDHAPYDNIQIPQELSHVVEDAISCGTGKRHRPWKAVAVCVPATIAACLVLLLNLSPSFASGACSLPVVGDVCRIFVFREYHTQDEIKYIDAVIPQIENTGKTQLEQRVNLYIQQLIQNCLDESEARAKEYYDAFVATGGDPADFHPIGITVDYEVTYLTSQYVSLHICHYETAIAAYQTDYYYTLDLESEKVLTLKDWFGSDYKQIVADGIRAALEAWPPENQWALWTDINLEDLITEQRNFYLNEDGQAVVVFDKYELACGAAGRPEFVISIPS